MAEKPIKKVLIAAAGTGGHVFPALSVAQKLHEQGIEIHWLGTFHGLENRVDLEFPLHRIHMKGLRGNGLIGWLLLPFRLCLAFYQTLRIMFKVKPNGLFCFGGYVCFPAGICAWLLHKPVFVQEQNAKGGLTNRILSFFAKKIFVAYPHAIRQYQHKQMLAGNPVRQIFIDKKLSQRAESIQKEKVNILVIGGSQGAHILNKIVPGALSHMQKDLIHVVHQCGEKNVDFAKAQYALNRVEVEVKPFILDMPQALSQADIVIARAGALTIAELTQIGVASILVPLPHAVDNHQYYNARFLTDNNAAILCEQDNLTKENLSGILHALIKDKPKRQQMAENALKLAKPNACNDIVNECIRLL